jgi:hypothetical protein
MVDFKKYFALVKEYNIRRPFSIHYEYALGGAQNGATKLTMKREDVMKAMKEDVVTVKRFLQEAGLK